MTKEIEVISGVVILFSVKNGDFGRKGNLGNTTTKGANPMWSFVIKSDRLESGRKIRVFFPTRRDLATQREARERVRDGNCGRHKECHHILGAQSPNMVARSSTGKSRADQMEDDNSISLSELHFFAA